MQKYRLGLYEKALPPELSFAQMLDETARNGFDSLEISIDESDRRLARLDWSADERKRLLLAAGDAGVPIATMCLSGHRRFPLGSHDAQVRKRSLEIFRRALALGMDLNVRVIQLAGYDVYYEDGDEDTARWFEENLRICAELAARAGMLLGFETMETSFLDTVSKAMRWVRRINNPYLGVYPDIGNLKNASLRYGTDLMEDIACGNGRIVAVHLKETKPGVYRNMAFGTGHTPYEPCMKAFRNMGVRHFTGEFWHQGEPDFRKTLSFSAAFLRERLDQAFREEA